MQQLEDCDALMWHFQHASAKDVLFAKQLLYSVRMAGKKVFPDFHTMWHFDDKIAQKYLLEAIGAPLVKSYVFYDKGEALEWAGHAQFPKVFKLRNGAGSANVRLANNRTEAKKLIKHAFGKGFSQYDAVSNLGERIRKYKSGLTGMKDVLKGIARLVYPTEFSRVAGRERGYAYFQEFIPGSDHDIRVVVIGKRAFAIKRMVRENDFRASGSGVKRMERHLFDEIYIKTAFNVAGRLQSQCMAFDFIDDNGIPKIIEMSYGFTTKKIDGYWDENLNWHNEPTSPQEWMVEMLVKNQL